MALWAAFLAWFGFAMTRQEMTAPDEKNLPGNGHLSPRSLNWLLVLAFLGATLICVLT